MWRIKTSIALVVLQIALTSSASLATDDKFGVGFVPKMIGGDDTESQLFEIVGEMPEVDQVFVIPTGIDMLKTLIKLKKLGRPLNYLVIAGHGSRDTPGIKWGADDMVPEEIDIAYNKQQLDIAEKAIKNPANTRLKPAVLQAKRQEFQQQVDLLEQAHGVMAENGIVLLINCSAAATPKGRKYIESFGQLLLGDNGGSIIASRSDVKINLRSSVLQRAWTQILTDQTFEHPEYLVKADWERFPIAGSKNPTLTGRWGFGNQYTKGNLQKFNITQINSSVSLVKPGESGNDIHYKGTVSGKTITGRWDYRPAMDWEGPFELAIDDNDHIHGWMSRDKEKGTKVAGAKEEFFLVREKK